MKINIVQIVLASVILIAMVLSVIWDPTGFYIRVDESGILKTIFNPDIREITAAILAYFVLLLALATNAVSIALLKAKIRSGYISPDAQTNTTVKRLVTTHVGLGLMLTVSTFLVVIWGFPTHYTFAISNTAIESVNFTPGPKFILAMGLSLLSCLLSIITLGFSVGQLHSIRRVRISFVSSRNESIV